MSYEEQREVLMAEVKKLLDEKKTADANAKMDEVKALDLAHEEELNASAALAVAEANKKALEGVKPVDMKDMSEKNKNVKEVKETMSNEVKAFGIDSPEYRNAFLKTLMGAKNLTEDEMVAMDSGSGSAGATIPTQTQNKIIEKMTKLAPMIGEIDLLQIPGFVRFPVEGTVNAAALHTENAAITASADTVAYVSLAGFEICKTLKISATLDTMSIDAFEKWVTDNLARSLADVIENYIINGTGSSQPKGIDAAETWTDATNSVDWAAANPTHGEILKQIALLPARYDVGAKFLCNKKTFYSNIMPVRDDSKAKLVELTPEGFVLENYPVLFSDKVPDGDLFLANFHEAVKANMAQSISIAADKSAGFESNSTVYRGACIFDCTVLAGTVIKGAATL